MRHTRAIRILVTRSRDRNVDYEYNTLATKLSMATYSVYIVLLIAVVDPEIYKEGFNYEY